MEWLLRIGRQPTDHSCLSHMEFDFRFIPSSILSSLSCVGFPSEREEAENRFVAKNAAYNVFVTSYDVVRSDAPFFQARVSDFSDEKYLGRNHNCLWFLLQLPPIVVCDEYSNAKESTLSVFAFYSLALALRDFGRRSRDQEREDESCESREIAASQTSTCPVRHAHSELRRRIMVSAQRKIILWSLPMRKKEDKSNLI